MKRRLIKGDYLVLGGLVGLMLLSGGVLATSNSSVSAETVSNSTTSNASVTVVFVESCSMAATVDTAHSAAIPNGIYSGSSDYYPNGIGQTTLKVACNDPNGFSLYAIGYTGEQYEGTNHTKLVGNNEPNNTIATGTATSGDNSNWAMKLATNAQATYPITLENGYGAFSDIPDTYTKVASRANATDVGESATGSTLTTTYAAYVSRAQPADTYTGKVKYTLVHPASEEPAQPQPSTPGYINYYANASTAEGTMGRQSAADGNTVKLFASNFSRDGYGFAGWSDAYDYATNANAHFYDDYQDMMDDKDFEGRTSSRLTDTEGYILLNGECDGDGIFDDDIYGGIYCKEDVVVIVLVRSDRDRDIDTINEFLRAIGYPHP